MINRSLIIGTRVAALMAAVLMTSQAFAVDVNARVVNVVGDAKFISPSGDSVPAYKGQMVPTGYKLQTGQDSAVGLSLVPGTGVVVEEESELTLGELSFDKSNNKITRRTAEVNLQKGSTIAFLNKMDGNTDFRVITARGIAAARGTVFRVNVDGTVSVGEGMVTVSLNDGTVISVPAGTGTTLEGDLLTIDDDTLEALTTALENAGFEVSTGTGGELIFTDPDDDGVVLELDEEEDPTPSTPTPL